MCTHLLALAESNGERVLKVCLTEVNLTDLCGVFSLDKNLITVVLNKTSLPTGERIEQCP